jgi:hypothetical protein
MTCAKGWRSKLHALCQPADFWKVRNIGSPRNGDPRECSVLRQAAVDADREPSCRYGVTGASTFVIGRYGVGPQPYETLEELMRKAATQEHAEG